MLKNLIYLSLALFLITGLTENAAAKNVLRGMLLKSTLKPLPHTEIELVPVNSKTFINDGRLTSISGVNGKFSFFDVPAGEYTLSINYGEKPTELSPYTEFFFPATENRPDAKVFRVSANSSIDNVVFRLPPPLLQKRITGKVVNLHGEPLAGVYVCLNDVKFDHLSFTFNRRTDKNGQFSLTGFKGREYEVAVIVPEKMIKTFEGMKVIGRGKSDRFTLDDVTPEITIKVRLIGEERYLNDKTIGKLFDKR